MTIIVYRDGVMASDSWITSGSMVTGEAVKIARTDTGWLAGAAGAAENCVAFLRFMRDFCLSGPFDESVRFTVVTDDDFMGIAVQPDGTVWKFGSRGIPYQVTAPWHAIGAAAAECTAVGAMFAGASAEQAVQACMARCCWIGGKIQVVRL